MPEQPGFPIFDAAHVASIGDVAVAPSNPNTIYVATGEQTNGDGVWKSTDAGATWLNIGFRTLRLFRRYWLIHTMQIWFTWQLQVIISRAMSAEFSNRLTAEIHGGRSGSGMIVPVRWSSTSIPTIHIRLSLPRCISHQRRRKTSEGVDTILMKSTDSGETWTLLGDQGLPPAHRMRTGLSIASGSGGKRIFALMAQGLFRSDDSGVTWQKITTDPRILGSNYFGRVFSDPKDPDVVYVMQTSTYRSADGGQRFEAWKGTPSGEDDHVLWIDPLDTNHILEGTDQGAVVTYDCGKSWNSWFNQPTGQFYRVSTDNSFPYRIYAAQQDSGSVVVPNRTDFGLITYRDWFSSGSFESSFIAPDPLNPDYIYSLGWYGNIIRMNRSTGQTETLFVAPANYRASWETPIVFSPRDSHALYYGSQFLVKSTDEGLTWHEVSPDLTLKSGTSSVSPKADVAGHVPSKDDIEDFGLFSDFSDDDDRDSQTSPVRAFIQSIAPSRLDDESHLGWHIEWTHTSDS